MRRRWFRYLIVFTLAVLSGTLLLHTSQRVQDAEDELRALEKAAANEQETIRVLYAEWEYLNRPDRLEALAGQYLNLLPPESGQMLASPAQLPDPFVPILPSTKPAYALKAQPVSMTASPSFKPLPSSSSSSSASVIKPRSKPVHAPKDFDKLLKQLQSGGAE